MASDSLRVGSAGLGPGTVLDGKYEILTRIGAGGMGEVFKARHVHLNTFRCIKVMKQGLLADEGYRLRFLREARLATQIHHPNIAVVHDFFLGEGGSYMVTEFIDGTTLRQWSASFGRFPLAIAADVASQVLAGLDHIHRRGLLHRDISPDNVMLAYDPDDRLIAKIIDLGIAKDMSTTNTDTTQAGVFVGNPKYMSPEQFGAVPDGEQIDGRTDLYSLGIVLYEMLLGVPPFRSETPQGYIVKHLTEPPMGFASANPTLTWPEGMESVIFRALEKDRKKRFSNARDFAHTLHKFLSAPIGSLSREEVLQLRGVTPPPAPEATVVQPMPWTHDSPTVAETPLPTEAKAKLFELELLDEVRDRQQGGDRDGLQRLAEAHPKGSAVGDAAREAIAQLSKAKQREQDEETAFQLAWEYGSSAAWRAFVDAHPGSSRMDRAQKLLEEALAFESAAGGPSDTGLREFLKVWPDGRHHLEAEIRLIEVKQKLADRAFEEACAADTYAALRDFGARFPTSPSAEEARRLAAERLAFESAASADHEEAWDAYLAKWSGDRHAADARTRRDAAKAREDEAWRRATEGKNAAAWQTFLTDFPHSKRLVRAERNRREAAAFDEAKSGGRAAMQDFVRVYADGLLIKEAQRLLRQLADDDDFGHAKSLDKPGAWQLYLATHPSGAHVQSARDRLAALEDAAFKAVLASKNPKAGAEFLTEFKESPRREELTAHITKWEQSAVVQEALASIAKGDCDQAESLLARITDEANRREILAALQTARDQQRWDAARKDDSILSLKAYLEAHPKGRWVKDAQKRLMKLHAASEASEPRDWDTAWETGTVAAWETYLAAHPDSRRLQEARTCRQEAADFDVAQKTNTSSMWRAFIKTWPEGRHRIDAEIRMRSAR